MSSPYPAPSRSPPAAGPGDPARALADRLVAARLSLLALEAWSAQIREIMGELRQAIRETEVALAEIDPAAGG
jgi:hypothetical protein